MEPRLSLVTLGVADVALARRFYEELGFKEREEQTRAIDSFLSRLKISEVGTSRLVNVAFRSADPKLASAVVNGLTEAYIAQNREFKATVAKEAADWLGDQLTEHRKQLRLSQETLQKYREQRPDASRHPASDRHGRHKAKSVLRFRR